MKRRHTKRTRHRPAHVFGAMRLLRVVLILLPPSFLGSCGHQTEPVNFNDKIAIADGNSLSFRNGNSRAVFQAGDTIAVSFRNGILTINDSLVCDSRAMPSEERLEFARRHYGSIPAVANTITDPSDLEQWEAAISDYRDRISALHSSVRREYFWMKLLLGRDRAAASCSATVANHALVDSVKISPPSSSDSKIRNLMVQFVGNGHFRELALDEGDCPMPRIPSRSRRPAPTEEAQMWLSAVSQLEAPGNGLSLIVGNGFRVGIDRPKRSNGGDR